MSWLPGQTLDRNTAITAMILADTTAEDDLHEGHRLWPHIQGWAAELGLTGPDAIAAASQPRRTASTMTGTRRRAARPGGSRLSANIAAVRPAGSVAPQAALAAANGSAAALPAPAASCPATSPYLDLSQYEQLIAVGIADADARDRPVDDVTARRLAIWMAARPQHPVLARGLARFARTGAISPS